MFAEGAGAKLYGVNSLDAIALAAFATNKSDSLPILVTADARRSELYWALYSGVSESGAPIMVEGPGVGKPAALEEMFANKYSNGSGFLESFMKKYLSLRTSNVSSFTFILPP
jgi:tRNA A37 threonylcarbamoyladenosine modification protein TsaB